ncbi:predicted protein [Histoplasma capsulatum var. duboisii H88]|uniref:Predicted protein n=1 Tax=Ajellomyces capsulatus (strain H88) TaxID=544711 RepID=F0UHE4_AJEC8|nr:predicted protein [Histoplasma capsulatum var. duboisii H88]
MSVWLALVFGTPIINVLHIPVFLDTIGVIRTRAVDRGSALQAEAPIVNSVHPTHYGGLRGKPWTRGRMGNLTLQKLEYRQLTSRKRALITRSTSCLLKKNSRLPNNTDNVGSNLQDRRRRNHYRNQGTGHSYWKILILNACTCSRYELDSTLLTSQKEMSTCCLLKIAVVMKCIGTSISSARKENEAEYRAKLEAVTKGVTTMRKRRSDSALGDTVRQIPSSLYSHIGLSKGLVSPVPYLSSQPCLGLLYNYEKNSRTPCLMQGTAGLHLASTEVGNARIFCGNPMLHLNCPAVNVLENLK